MTEKSKQGRRYTPDEIKIINVLTCSGISNGDIAKFLGRSLDAIKIKKHSMGIRREVVWPGENDEKLVAMTPTHTDLEIAEVIGCSRRAIQRRRHRLGLLKTDKKYQPWRDTEIELLRCLWVRKKSDAAIGSILGRTTAAVRQRRLECGFVKSVGQKAATQSSKERSHVVRKDREKPETLPESPDDLMKTFIRNVGHDFSGASV